MGLTTRNTLLGCKEVTRCTYEDGFPVGSRDEFGLADVDFADVIAREPFVAPAAALNLLSVSCREGVRKRLKTTSWTDLESQ
jgi:hypothetical protein